MQPRDRAKFSALAAFLLAISGPRVTAGGGEAYEFSGPEIFPLEGAVGQMRMGDFNGDGSNDLLVVDNSRARIQLLHNQTGQPERKPDVLVKVGVNDLPPGSRFRLDSIPSEKRISSLAVADLNADGKPDIAYYGEPKELIVVLNEGGGQWAAPRRFPIDDGLLDPYALSTGDLNADGRADLLLLADGHVHFLAQGAAGLASEPVRIPYSGSVKTAQIVDLNGDRRDDLLLVNWDHLNPFRIRRQDAEGRLGPERHVGMQPVRSYWADDLDGDGVAEIVTIGQKSGRAQVGNFERREAEEILDGWKAGQFEILAMNKSGKGRRGVAWTDLNGDGLIDLTASEPESGQISIRLQLADGSYRPASVFASLSGVADLSVADWDGDGRMEIFQLSADERQVGVATYDEKGRVAFPDAVPVEGRPLAMTTAAVRPGERASLAMVVERNSKRELEIRRSDGTRTSQKLSDAFKGTPSSIMAHDVNQDGLLDFVVLIPYEKLKFLLQVPGRDFLEVDIAPPGGNLEQPWASAGDVDGDGKPELLLAQKNYLRAVVLRGADLSGAEEVGKAAWTLKVKEQVNGAFSNSRVAAAAALPQPGSNLPVIALLDAERKWLTFSRKNEEGAWLVVKNIPLPATDFQSLQQIGVGGADFNAVGFMGSSSIAWLNLSGKVWAFAEKDGYETPIKDGFLRDVISGDLNQSGRKDLVFIETGRSYLDIVSFQPPHTLRPAMRWQVFEERTFRNRRNDMGEPREALAGDFTGDGLKDLAVLVHDRILLYPQAPAAAQEARVSSPANQAAAQN
jgi:hypothetical protein